jgi:NADH-quinone oxidoreductase subunit G
MSKGRVRIKDDVMPTLKIDDREVTVEPGTNLIQAAEKLGIEIPYFCYHPKLIVEANCRMCLVKVEKIPRPVPACSTIATDDMIVSTKTAEIEKARQGVLEFILINHPLDCPICDQAGECVLQEYTHDYGPAHSRFVEDKVLKPKKVPLGPHVIFDAERCIVCTRCVRFCRDVVGEEELGIFHRGDRQVIDVFPGRELRNKYSANVVDICPVGALTTREFRFRNRVWFLQSTESVCTNCSNGCNIWVDTNLNKIQRLRPRINDAVNEHWMCDAGRFGFEYVNRPDRLETPLVRHGEAMLPVLWDEALHWCAEALRGLQQEHGTGAVAGVGSSKMTNEELFLFRRLLREVLGSPHLDVPPPPEGDEDDFLIRKDKAPNARGVVDLDCRPGAGGLDLQGIRQGIRTGAIKGLYVVQENLAADPEWREALSQLEFLVVQDILPNETTQLAHVVLPGVSFAEKEGTFTNYRRRVQRVRRALKPFGLSKPDWQIFIDLANRLGASWPYTSVPMVTEEIGREIAAYAGVTYEKVGSQGIALE